MKIIFSYINKIKNNLNFFIKKNIYKKKIFIKKKNIYKKNFFIIYINFRKSFINIYFLIYENVTF